MVDKRVIARERSDRSNLAQITGLLRLRLAMTASDFSIIVIAKKLDCFGSWSRNEGLYVIHLGVTTRNAIIPSRLWRCGQVLATQFSQ